jgi:hypothetical protein
MLSGTVFLRKPRGANVALMRAYALCPPSSQNAHEREQQDFSRSRGKSNTRGSVCNTGMLETTRPLGRSTDLSALWDAGFAERRHLGQGAGGGFNHWHGQGRARALAQAQTQVEQRLEVQPFQLCVVTGFL